MKKKIILIAALLGIVAVSQYLLRNNPQEPTHTLPLDENISSLFDVNGNYVSVTDHYEIRANIFMDSHPQIFNVIHHEMENKIKEFKKNASLNNTDGNPWVLELNTQKYTSHNINSYLIGIYINTGGAHPNTSTLSFHEDITTHKLINFSDVIVRMGVMAHFLSAAKDNLTVHYEEGITPTNMENWSNWFIENEALVFVFDPYQIAPYAVGTQTLAFNLNNISHLIKPQYQ